jgi:hypothetical protein
VVLFSFGRNLLWKKPFFQRNFLWKEPPFEGTSFGRNFFRRNLHCFSKLPLFKSLLFEGISLLGRNLFSNEPLYEGISTTLTLFIYTRFHFKNILTHESSTLLIVIYNGFHAILPNFHIFIFVYFVFGWMANNLMTRKLPLNLILILLFFRVNDCFPM